MNHCTKSQCLHSCFESPADMAKPSSDAAVSGFIKASELVDTTGLVKEEEQSMEAIQSATDTPSEALTPAFVSASKLLSLGSNLSKVDGTSEGSHSADTKTRKNKILDSPKIPTRNALSCSIRSIPKKTLVGPTKKDKQLEELSRNSPKITSFFKLVAHSYTVS